MRRQTKTLQMLQPSKNVLQELKETVSAVNTTQNALEANDRIEKNIKKFIGVQISYKIHQINLIILDIDYEKTKRQ